MIQYDKSLYPKPYVEGKYAVFFHNHGVTFGVLELNKDFWWSVSFYSDNKISFINSSNIFNDFDSAFNACRNWMKNNQNLVYGEQNDPRDAVRCAGPGVPGSGGRAPARDLRQHEDSRRSAWIRQGPWRSCEPWHHASEREKQLQPRSELWR